VARSTARSQGTSLPRFPNASLAAGAPRSPGQMVFLVILVSTIARLFFAAAFDYGVDEAYAVAVSRSFQWSFFDHPPITFWTAGLIDWLWGGHAPHWLTRLPFVFAFSGTLTLIYLIGKRLFSAAAGLWAVVFLSVAPFFVASAGSWIVPDGPVDFFLAASALVLIRILYDDLAPEDITRNWITLGIFFGLATLSKYHAFLVAFGAVIFLLATPHRRMLARPAPWIAGLIALLIFSPVVYWNATQGWISIAFQSGRSNAGHGFYPVHLLQMIGGEAAYLLPWTLVLATIALIRALLPRAPWLSGDRAREQAFLLASLGLPAILLFTVLPLVGSRGLPHWPMPGWLLVFPILGAWMADIVERGHRWPVHLARVSAALIAVLVIALAAIMNSTFLDTWLAKSTDAFAPRGPLTPLINEGADWKGLDTALADKGLAPTDGRFIVALKWHEAARIGAVLSPAIPVTVFDTDARGFAFLVDQATLEGKDAVVITRAEDAGTLARLNVFFDRVDTPQPLTLSVAGGVPFHLVATLAHGLKMPYPLPYGINGKTRK
jgi:4-amino-4-deoxy-L-arabinose transferase-like glycosyltransferase